MSQCNLGIHMEANAERDEVLGVASGYLRIKIAVQPDDDEPWRGNKELIALLSNLLDISQDRISILQGENYRIKLIGIDGLEMRQVMDKLKPHMKA